LLDSVANKIWYIEDQQIKVYPGTYQEYEDWQQKRVAKAKNDTSAKKSKKEVSKAPVVKTNEEQERKKEINKLNRQLEQLEQDMTEKGTKLAGLESALASEGIYQNPEKLAHTTQAYETLKAELTNLQQDWEKLAEQIMAIE